MSGHCTATTTYLGARFECHRWPHDERDPHIGCADITGTRTKLTWFTGSRRRDGGPHPRKAVRA